ncbi:MULTISPECIES: RNA-guided endonuclease TnpB family protein [unclassified Meiothermus]|uniref:RNA-guided endonuclease InsQ/TnpB family protein n=1 Tax=unclassified Meiothermus TaxID=370471 RepID=UPI000D7BCAA8|nr:MULTISPECIES: RNA-guided endonuclease TnpB family protein [unclassified Meiothermus]PZA06033.1 transposase [Meiothermus sp. Pnk-1]RYM36171.1 transposase [Meiothermus sp. PNK-Is4]
MSMQRTSRLRLEPTREQADALLETLRQHTECFNAVSAYGWQHREKNGVRLHHATYRALRERFPALPAQLVIAARERAREALRSALTRARRGKKASQPRSRLCPIRYDARTYTLCTAKGYVSFASVAGRLKIPFAANPHAQGILDRAVGFGSADLIFRRGRLWLHVAVTLPDPAFQPSGLVVGVDLGLSRPAVGSNNRFFGERRWKEIERRYFRLRRGLQRKGTHSALRHLRRLAGKVNRFRRDCDHVLSRRIVNSVQPGTVIVVENLVDIRSRTKQRGRESRRRLHSWSFARLKAFLVYKAEAMGCRVVGVDPRHTSQTCSRCGYVHRSNRRSQSRFLCRACGFELNADLNAARNIARKYLAGGGMPAAGGPPSTGPSCQPAPAG